MGGNPLIWFVGWEKCNMDSARSVGWEANTWVPSHNMGVDRPNVNKSEVIKFCLGVGCR